MKEPEPETLLRFMELLLRYSMITILGIVVCQTILTLVGAR